MKETKENKSDFEELVIEMISVEECDEFICEFEKLPIKKETKEFLYKVMELVNNIKGNH